MYELPFGRGKMFFSERSRLVDKLVGGWKLNNIWTEQNGHPLVFAAVTTGIGNARPNLTGVSPIIRGNRPNTQRVGAWFNTAAFVAPPPYTYGNVRRTFDQVTAPGLQNLDTSLVKDTRLEGV